MTNKTRKRKLTVKWTNEQTLLLIAEVEGKEALWNWALPQYKDRRVRDMIWEDIAEKLEMEKSEIVNKWNSIRNTFRMSLNKWKSTKSLEVFLAKTQNNEIFNSLMFLEPTLRAEEAKTTNAENVMYNSCTETDPEDVCIKTEDMDSTCSRKSFCNGYLENEIQHFQSNSHETENFNLGEHLTTNLESRTNDKPACYFNNHKTDKPITNLTLKSNTSTNLRPSHRTKPAEHNIETKVSTEKSSNFNSSDEWAEIGKFIAMNGNKWSNTHPQRAAKFRSALYKLVYETDLEEMTQINSDNSFSNDK